MLNETHLVCTTVRLHNAAPATVRVTLDNGTTWLPGSPVISFVALVEVAVGRRPYTSEVGGVLVVKVRGGALPATAAVVVSASLPRDVHGPLLIANDTSARAGTTTLVPFLLGPLPATVFALLTVTAHVPGHGALVYEKNFQRAPPPSNPNVTVVVVDHTTRGIVVGRGRETPWLPFLAVGWFNSAFTYVCVRAQPRLLLGAVFVFRGQAAPQSRLAHRAPLPPLPRAHGRYTAEGAGSGGGWAPAPAAVSPLLVAGASRANEWGRKGVNLVRMGWRSPPALMLAELDQMHSAGVYAVISVPTPGHCNDTAPPGKPPRNCTADYVAMLGNMTVVREHPATWGYYICDDCCAGYNYLLELKVVYEAMKRIDPYHVTTGALECGEMHAFQEPHLSLDVPMRENYRPDLAFHANDGVRHDRGGGDGALRMPPMTFEPMINMPDAVRQPRPKLARTAAWLAAITADMPIQIWYVFNHIMFARWLLEDSTSQLNAQMLELAPSLLGRVTTVQPVVALTVGDEWARARAWRDADFEEKAPGHLCVHVAVASVGALPATFTLRLEGLCADGLGSCPPGQGLSAAHLFEEDYSVPVLELPPLQAPPRVPRVHTFSDVLTPGSTAVYAIGCASWVRPAAANLVNDPRFEDTELPLTPGFITCAEEGQYPRHTFKGQCKVEDKHAGSWGLNQNPEHRDGRAAFFVDSILPHAGRHSGRVWLPTEHAVTFGIPGHTTNLDGIPVGNGTELVVELYARSFPPGARIQISVGTWVDSHATGASPIGQGVFSVYTPGPGQPKPDAAAVLAGNWTKITATIPKAVRPASTTLNLRVGGVGGSSGQAGAASVWIDDVSVRASTPTN